MKEILEIHGYEKGTTGSPKIILRTAYKAEMIKNEKNWLKALQRRNNEIYFYDEKIALGIVRQTKSIFFDLFVKLMLEFDANWL